MCMHLQGVEWSPLEKERKEVVPSWMLVWRHVVGVPSRPSKAQNFYIKIAQNTRPKILCKN